MKKSKILTTRSLEKFIFFILSPFLSLPIILWDTLNKSKGSLVLLTITYALISYLYIPMDGDDKFYYINLFEDFKTLDFNGFIFFLTLEATDFFYYLIFYIYSQVGFTSGFFFFSITLFTVGVSIYVFNKILQRFEISGKRYCLFIIILLLSFSLVNLLSGFRFYLASSFILLGIYHAFFSQKKILGFIFMILGIVTHFSVLLFFGTYLFTTLFKNSPVIIKSFFIFSLLFLVLPNSVMLDTVNSLGLEGIFQKKAAGYLDEEGDMVKEGIEQGNSNNLIKVISDNIWLLFVYMMLFSKKYTDDIYKKLLMISIAFIHIFFMAPDVFLRYSIVVKFFLLIFLISNEWNKKLPKYTLIFLFLFGLNFIFSLIALRTRFVNSFSNLKSYSLITIFFE